MPTKAELSALLALALVLNACQRNPNPQADTSPAPPYAPAVPITPAPPYEAESTKPFLLMPTFNYNAREATPTRSPHSETLIPGSRTPRENVLFINDTRQTWLYRPSALKAYKATFKYFPSILTITDNPNAQLSRTSNDGMIVILPGFPDPSIQVIALCLTRPGDDPNEAIQNEVATIYYLAAMGLPYQYLQQFLLQPAPSETVYNEYVRVLANVGSLLETDLTSAIENFINNLH